jgi:hypothetical protein
MTTSPDKLLSIARESGFTGPLQWPAPGLYIADESALATFAERIRAEQQELIDRLRLEAQIHAQEARTQRATVHEIYQLVTGGTGEPGDWNGAEPVRQALESIRLEERERCAVICDEVERQQEIDNGAANTGGAQVCADAIRSISTTESKDETH